MDDLHDVSVNIWVCGKNLKIESFAQRLRESRYEVMEGIQIKN